MSGGFGGGVRNVHKIKDYTSAEAFLLKGKNKDDRPLPGKATRLHRRADGSIAVKYHAVDIVTYHEDGRVTFDTGGWNAMTTRDKITVHLPTGWSLGVCDGLLWLRIGGYHDSEAKSWPVNRTATITPAGEVATDSSVEDQKETTRLRKQTAAFAVKFIEAFLNGDVPRPDNGDCWHCAMFNKDGTPGRGGDHLQSHMSDEESYFVPSLLVNAVRAFGAPYYHDVLACFWTNQKDDWIPAARKRHAANSSTRQALTNYVRRFIRRELGLEFSR